MSLLFVVVAIVGILASVLFDPSRSRSNDPPPILMVTLLALGVLVSLPPFIGLIGSALCLSTPAETRGRIYLILSLVLDLAALGLMAAPFAVEEIFAREKTLGRRRSSPSCGHVLSVRAGDKLTCPSCPAHNFLTGWSDN